MEAKIKSNGEKGREKERKYGSTETFYLFYLFLSFFLFRLFLKILCAYGVYVGRPPGDGIRPSIGNARSRRERTADLGFVGVLTFFCFLSFHEK